MKKQFSLIRGASDNKFLSAGDVKTSQKVSRREFLSATAATAFSFTIRLDLDQPDGSTFQVVTATRMTRKTQDDAFWQTVREQASIR